MSVTRSLGEMPFRSPVSNLPCSYYCMHVGTLKASLSFKGQTTLPPEACWCTIPMPLTRHGKTLSSRSPENTLGGAFLAQKPSPPRLQGPHLRLGMSGREQDTGLLKTGACVRISNTPGGVRDPQPRSQGNLPPGGRMPAWKAALTMQAYLTLLGFTDFTN